MDAGGSPDGWTVRVGRVVAAVVVRRVVVQIALDARPRIPPGGADDAGASPVTRDAFSHGWIEDAGPGSPPGPVTMVSREDGRRDA